MVDASSIPRLRRPLEIAATLTVVMAATGGAWLLFGHTSLPDVTMVYLLGVVAVAMWASRLASVVAAALSVLSYDFFFVPPYLSLRFAEAQYAVTFLVMFVIGVVISTLMQRIREQREAARAREERTERLFAMTRELSSTRGLDRLQEVATRHLSAFFDGDAVLLVPGPKGQLEEGAASELAPSLGDQDRRAAEWAWQHDEPAGPGTLVFPSSAGLFVPLIASHGRVGVLGVVPRHEGRFSEPQQRQLLETFAAQIAGALERARIAGEAEAARLEAEAERLQSSLLSSVSHDLRTPLAVITGAASTLLSAAPSVDPAAQRDLLEAIYDESVRLSRLVGNLLDMTRLAAGAMKVHKEWQSIEAVVGAAAGRVEDRLGGRPLKAQVPADLPLVPFDAVLVEQVLINLMENAAKYSPAGAPIEVSASAGASGEVVLEVKDRGPGVPEPERQRIFDKFYRVRGAPTGGAGLGLAICRGIVEAHGGRIEALAREGGGSVFRFTLPSEGSPPSVEEDAGLP
jgi:two-component system sensor histidine kinase KdpD